MSITINTILSITEPNPEGKGYKWTLPSLLGDMLNKAEELFGPRDMCYTVLGIEFENNGPQVWYPGDCKHIVIQLNPTVDNIYFICYQLAQETIHLLAPTGLNDANYLEEGVSIYFAVYYMREHLNHPIQPTAPKYRTAFDLVEPILDADIECIKRLREDQPTFSKMTPEQLQTVLPDLDSKTINVLLTKF